METLLNEELYSVLLDDKATREISDLYVNEHGYSLEEAWGLMDANAVNYPSAFNFSYQAKKTIQAFVLINAATFIPCGEIGHDYVYEITKGKEYGISTIRMNRFKKLYANSVSKIDEKDMNTIQTFFEEYEIMGDINYSDPMSLAITICRIFDRMVSNYGDEIFTTGEEIAERLNAFTDLMVLDNGHTSYLPELLRNIRYRRIFNKESIKFVETEVFKRWAGKE